MVDETQSWGIDVPLTIPDGSYGDTAAFRFGLEERGLHYAVGISSTVTAHLGDAVPSVPPYRPPTGGEIPQPCQERKAADHRRRTQCGQSRAVAGGFPSGHRPQRSQAHVRAIRRLTNPSRWTADPENLSRSGTACMLAAGRMARRRTRAGSVLALQPPADTPLTTLVRLTKLRWRIEHEYREMKQALGLAHFEGRTWQGWHHHVTPVSAAHAFCTLQRITRSPKETASGASTGSPPSCSYSSRSGPAPAPPVTATYPPPHQPDQALLGDQRGDLLQQVDAAPELAGQSDVP